MVGAIVGANVVGQRDSSELPESDCSLVMPAHVTFFSPSQSISIEIASKRKVDLCVCADSRWHLAADQLAGSDAI